MSAARAFFAAVDAGEIEEYPLGPEDRADSHFFLPWRFRRWLNSDMRLKGSEEARALYFDLICLSQDQSPAGTLPRDTELLSRMLHVSERRFRQLCEQDYGPLHNWRLCLCGDEVRLYHPVVLDGLVNALARREDNRARNEAANARKRRQRLREALAMLNADLARQDAVVAWIDDWLVEAGCERRTTAWLQRALAAWHDQALRSRRGVSS